MSTATVPEPVSVPALGIYYRDGRLVGCDDGSEPLRWRQSVVAAWHALAQMHRPRKYFSHPEVCNYLSAHWNQVCWPFLRSERWRGMPWRALGGASRRPPSSRPTPFVRDPESGFFALRSEVRGGDGAAVALAAAAAAAAVGTRARAPVTPVRVRVAAGRATATARKRRSASAVPAADEASRVRATTTAAKKRRRAPAASAGADAGAQGTRAVRPTWPPHRRPHTLVIGAGAAGLSAARRLVDAPTAGGGGKAERPPGPRARARAAGAAGGSGAAGSGARAAAAGHVFPTVTVLEARDRPGGRVLTARLPGGGPEKLPHIPVDVGASVMHGCGDANQSVFRRAVEDGIRAPAVAGGAFYECTEHAKWFGSGGEALETRVVAEMHALFWLIGRCLSAASRAAQDAGGDLMAGYSAAKRYVLENTTARPKQLTDVEEAVLEKIRIRSFAYCSRMDRMALHQASVGGDSGGDAGGMAAVIGLAAKGAEEDAAGVPRELRPRNVARAAAMLRKRVARADDPLCAVASRRPSVTPDRIVVDGYTPFLIDKMVAGLDVRYACVVDQVEYRWAGGTGVDADGRKGGDGYRVRVVTKDGAQYFADHVIVTLPIGVLQTKDPRSCVRFLPELSVAKRTAVDGLGMGVHNKVVLRFRPEDVFWPPGTPQLNCVDPRFQFLNLNAYDKPGVLLAHVFGGTSFAAGYDGLDDDGVVREVLGVLRAMFYPGPAPLVKGGGVGDRAVGEAVKAVGGAVAGVVVEACGRVTSSEVAVDEAPVGGGDERTVRNGKGVGTRPGRRGARRSSARISAVAREERRPAPSIPTIHRPRCKPATFPEPIDAIVTRWDSDPFAFGSYSYLPCGADWGMINEMAVPEPRAADAPSLFFAGEHCDDLGWQCVHGACESGTQSAALILDIVNGVPRQVRTESFRGTAGVASEAGSRCCA